MTEQHSAHGISPLDRAQLLAKLTIQQAALAAFIKILSYQENTIDVQEITNLQINISSTLDLLLNPIAS